MDGSRPVDVPRILEDAEVIADMLTVLHPELAVALCAGLRHLLHGTGVVDAAARKQLERFHDELQDAVAVIPAG